jgi:hypothetical protein
VNEMETKEVNRLSNREIARATNNPEEFAEICKVLARKAQSEGGWPKKRFLSFLRPAFHNMHVAGVSKERLRDLQRTARAVFHQCKPCPAPTSATHLPACKFVSQQEIEEEAA